MSQGEHNLLFDAAIRWNMSPVYNAFSIPITAVITPSLNRSPIAPVPPMVVEDERPGKATGGSTFTLTEAALKARVRNIAATERWAPPRMPSTPWLHDAMKLPDAPTAQAASMQAEYKEWNWLSLAMGEKYLYEETRSYSPIDEWLTGERHEPVEQAVSKYYSPSIRRRARPQFPRDTTERVETALNFTRELPELPENLPALEALRRACLHMEERSESRDRLAHLMLTFKGWSEEHFLGLTELLSAMADGGEALANECYEGVKESLECGQERRLYIKLEQISRDVPKRLLSAPSPDTLRAAQAREWLRHTQGSKRLRPLVGLPLKLRRDVYMFLKNPWRFEQYDLGAEAFVEKVVRDEVMHHLQSSSRARWSRLAMDLLRHAEHSTLSAEDYAALRGCLLASGDSEHQFRILPHPERYTYQSFLALGRMAEEYNDGWALSAWAPGEYADGSFHGFQLS